MKILLTDFDEYSDRWGLTIVDDAGTVTQFNDVEVMFGDVEDDIDAFTNTPISDSGRYSVYGESADDIMDDWERHYFSELMEVGK